VSVISLCPGLAKPLVPDDRLSDTVPGRDYPFHFLLHGVVQHSLHHAGQMAMLKVPGRE